eukprot:Hpha_TRINITY_DN28955_c0_g1::TRINITY_DN28955_c0_g1_i1::g.19480::m.19480
MLRSVHVVRHLRRVNPARGAALCHPPPAGGPPTGAGSGTGAGTGAGSAPEAGAGIKEEGPPSGAAVARPDADNAHSTAPIEGSPFPGERIPRDVRQRMQEAAGVVPRGHPVPPPVTFGSADEWQPPRLRDHPPYITKKWKWRGGYYLIWQGIRTPVACGLFLLFTIQFRNWWYDWMYGKPEFETALENYIDWDGKRPSWPPLSPWDKEAGRKPGIKHEIW